MPPLAASTDIHMCHVGLDVLSIVRRLYTESEKCSVQMNQYRHFENSVSPFPSARLLRMLTFTNWSIGQSTTPPGTLLQPFYISSTSTTPRATPLPSSPVPSTPKWIASIIAFAVASISARHIYLLALVLTSLAHLHPSEASDIRQTSNAPDYEPFHHHRSSEGVLEWSSDYPKRHSVEDVDVACNDSLRLPIVDLWPVADWNELNQLAFPCNGFRPVNQLSSKGNMSWLDYEDGSHLRSPARLPIQPDLLSLSTLNLNTTHNKDFTLTAASTVNQSWLVTNMSQLATNLSFVTNQQVNGTTTSRHNLSELSINGAIYGTSFGNGTQVIVLEPDLRVHHPILAVILAFICVVVVFGNVLTMVSIFKERYLHTVTNYFVASLAFSDCLVGALVMPFSVVLEVKFFRF